MESVVGMRVTATPVSARQAAVAPKVFRPNTVRKRRMRRSCIVVGERVVVLSHCQLCGTSTGGRGSVVKEEREE